VLQRLPHRSPALRRAALACLLTSFSVTALEATEGTPASDDPNAQLIIRSTRRGWDGRGVESVKQNVQLKTPAQKPATGAVPRSVPQSVSASSIQLRPIRGDLQFKPAPSTTLSLGQGTQKGLQGSPSSPNTSGNPVQQPAASGGAPPKTASSSPTAKPEARIAKVPGSPSAVAPVEQLPKRGSVADRSPAEVDPNDGWVARKAIRQIAPLTDPVPYQSRVPSADLAAPRNRPSDSKPLPSTITPKTESASRNLSKNPPRSSSLDLAPPANERSRSDQQTQPQEAAKSVVTPSKRNSAPVPVIKPEQQKTPSKQTPSKAKSTPPETDRIEPKRPSSEPSPQRSASNPDSDTQFKYKSSITDLDEQDGRVQVRALKIERDGAIAGKSATESKPKETQSSTPKAPSSRRGQEQPNVSAKKQEETAAQPTRIASRSKQQTAKVPAAEKLESAESQRVDEVPSVPLDFTGRPSSPITVNRTVARLRTPIRRTLQYFYQRPEKADGRSNWGMMHAVMVYGVDTKVQVGRRQLSTIAWMAGNNLCRGKRLLAEGEDGIRAADGVGLQGHQGQFLMVLSLAGVPSSYPLYANGKKYSVADLVRREAKTCRTGEELTFSLIGLSHYLSTDETWTNEDGERWDFERLIAEELSQPIVGAACGGTHRLMGFAHALRHRRNEGLPITGQWARAEKFLDDFAVYTYRLQNRDGSFSTAWFEEPENRDDLDRKIQTTGHMVEWLLTHTPDDELQNPRLVAAIRFLTNSLLKDLDHDWSIGPKGHALRSLSLYHDRVFGGPSAWKSTSMASSNGSTRSRSSRTR